MDVKRRKSESERKAEFIALRVRPDVKERLQAKARAEGVPVSALVRSIVEGSFESGVAVSM